MIVNFADLIFEVKNERNPFLSQRFQSYLSSLAPHFKIDTFYVDELEIRNEKPLFSTDYYDLFQENSDSFVQYQRNEKNSEFYGKIEYLVGGGKIFLLKSEGQRKNDYFEYFLIQYVVTYHIMREKTAILVHGSCLKYREKAYLFTAKSGTGKSTHTRLWMQYTDAEYINDDKNYLIYEEDAIWVYGNPWSGKHFKDRNIRAKLESIIYLHQSKKNVVSDIKGIEKLKFLLGQVIRLNPLYDQKKWEWMTDLLMNLKSYKYGCNMEQEAVEVIRKKLEE